MIDGAAVNVLDFGAVGDGVTDDYVAIQAALDAGGSIIFPAGTYLVGTQIRIGSNSTLDLTSSAVIQRGFNTSESGVGLAGITTGSTNVKILGGTFDANGTVYGTESCNALSGLTLSNVEIKGTTFLDCVDYHAIDFGDATNILIENCKFYGQIQTGGFTDKEAIQLDPGYSLAAGYGHTENFVVKRCVFDGNSDTGTPAYQCAVGNHSANVDGVRAISVTVSECVINNCSYAGIHVYAWEDATISDNTFNGCAIDVYVWRGSGTNTVGIDGLNIINNAFNNTASTNSIYFFNNTTSIATMENILIEGNVFKTNNTCIRALEVYNMIISNNIMRGASTVINLRNVTDINITGNSIKDVSGTGIYLTESVRRVSITGNIMQDLDGRAVHVTGENAVDRTDITISGNQISDCAGAAFIACDTGASSNVSICNNHLTVGILGKTISGLYYIYVSATGAGLSVYDNIVDDAIIATSKTIHNPNGSTRSIVDLALDGAAGSRAKIGKNQTTLRDELQIYAGGDAYSAGSAGAGIHLYGNSDDEHAGNMAVLTGPDDNGDGRMIVSGWEDKTHITIGNSIWDYVDEFRDIGLLNLKDPNGQPALHISGASTTEGDIAVPTGEAMSLGHWTPDGSPVTGTFVPRLDIQSSGGVKVYNVDDSPSTPVSGGVLYVDGGALKYIGSSGTVTTLAIA